MAFKMKGFSGFQNSPIKRNDPPTSTSWIEADREYNAIKSGDRKLMAKRFSKRYNTNITKKGGIFSDSQGTSVADLEKKFLSAGNFTYTGG